MKKLIIVGISGFAIVLILFASGREVVLSNLSAPEQLGSAFHWLGTFRWLYDYQTLIALIGAWWAASAVHAQMRQTDIAAKRSRESRKQALRAVLPFTLGALSDYANTCTTVLLFLFEQLDRQVLPPKVKIPEFPALPVEAIKSVADFVEVAEEVERSFLRVMLASLQIQNARLIGLQAEHGRDGHITFQANLERYLVDAAEVSAQAAALYDYARQADIAMPRHLSRDDVGKALPVIGIHDEIRDNLVSTYRLSGPEKWVPPFTVQR